MSFLDVLESDTQREHAFQKKIPGEKKSLFGRQLGEIELFSKNTKAILSKTWVFTSQNLKKQNLTQQEREARFKKETLPRARQERAREKKEKEKERERTRKTEAAAAAAAAEREKKEESESKERERKTENEKEKKREEDNQQQKLTIFHPFLTLFGTILGFILVTLGVPFGGLF